STSASCSIARRRALENPATAATCAPAKPAACRLSLNSAPVTHSLSPPVVAMCNLRNRTTFTCAFCYSVGMDQAVDYRAELAKLVRKKREAQGWSQDYLGERWGRSRHSALRLEKGEIDTELNTLAELAGVVFGMTLVDFLAELLIASGKQLPAIPLDDLFT